MVAPPTAGVAARDKTRVRTLDGIRGICAMAVVFTHVAFATFVLSSAAGPPREGIWSILAAGQLSIGPFFIMSGLFLYKPFVRRAFLGTAKPDLGRFFVRRGARLLPAFWLMTAFCLLVLNLDALQGVWDVLRPFLLLHIYDFHYYAGLDVAWTVPAETQFYLALPVLAWFIHRLGRGVDDPARKARRMLVPLGVLVVLQFAWTAYVHSAYEAWPPQYFWPFGITGLFAIGMAMAIWSVLAEVSPGSEPAFWRLAVRRPHLFWLGALVAYAINCAQPFGVPGTADWQTTPAALVRDAMLLSFSFLLMVPLVVPGAASRFMEVTLGNGVMRYLGRISYGIYLWHFPMMYLRFGSGSIFGETVPVQMLLGKFGFWALVIPVALSTIAVASVSYWVLERPVIRLADRWAAARKAKEAAARPVAPAAEEPLRQEERSPAAI
ncbi:acyltransferase [Microbispora sp. ZYX-F-249]|uniref:Acyltransferase n=1 Tax=Microbispora maris TaxID=3144104 RepID=A0ABV0AYL3_9ACTN